MPTIWKSNELKFVEWQRAKSALTNPDGTTKPDGTKLRRADPDSGVSHSFIVVGGKILAMAGKGEYLGNPNYSQAFGKVKLAEDEQGKLYALKTSRDSITSFGKESAIARELGVALAETHRTSASKKGIKQPTNAPQQKAYLAYVYLGIPLPDYISQCAITHRDASYDLYFMSPDMYRKEKKNIFSNQSAYQNSYIFTGEQLIYRGYVSTSYEECAWNNIGTNTTPIPLPEALRQKITDIQGAHPPIVVSDGITLSKNVSTQALEEMVLLSESEEKTLAKVGGQVAQVDPAIRNELLTETRGSILSNDQCYQFAIKLMLILDDLHARGYIHKDLHEANVVVDEQGDPHLIDFGKTCAPYWLDQFQNEVHRLFEEEIFFSFGTPERHALFHEKMLAEQPALRHFLENRGEQHCPEKISLALIFAQQLTLLRYNLEHLEIYQTILPNAAAKTLVSWLNTHGPEIHQTHAALKALKTWGNTYITEMHPSALFTEQLQLLTSSYQHLLIAQAQNEHSVIQKWSKTLQNTLQLLRQTHDTSSNSLLTMLLSTIQTHIQSTWPSINLEDSAAPSEVSNELEDESTQSSEVNTQAIKVFSPSVPEATLSQQQPNTLTTTQASPSPVQKNTSQKPKATAEETVSSASPVPHNKAHQKVTLIQLLTNFLAKTQDYRANPYQSACIASIEVMIKDLNFQFTIDGNDSDYQHICTETVSRIGHIRNKAAKDYKKQGGSSSHTGFFKKNVPNDSFVVLLDELIDEIKALDSNSKVHQLK